MNIKILIAAVAALSFAATGAADAKKSKYKRHGAYYGPYAYVHAPPHFARTPGPPWAAPWECFTDEGYGRYRPCSAGRR